MRIFVSLKGGSWLRIHSTNSMPDSSSIRRSVKMTSGNGYFPRSAYMPAPLRYALASLGLRQTEACPHLEVDKARRIRKASFGSFSTIKNELCGSVSKTESFASHNCNLKAHEHQVHPEFTLVPKPDPRSWQLGTFSLPSALDTGKPLRRHALWPTRIWRRNSKRIANVRLSEGPIT